MADLSSLTKEQLLERKQLLLRKKELQSQKATQAPAEPGFFDRRAQEVEQDISNRPSFIKGAGKGIDEAQAKYGDNGVFGPLMKDPLGAATTMAGITGNLGMGGLELAEASVANPLLALQQGKSFREFGGDLASTLQGERPAEMGDVFYGGGLPRWLANTMGLISTMGGGIEAASKSGASRLAKPLVGKGVSQFTDPVVKPIVRVADMLGKHFDRPMELAANTAKVPFRALGGAGKGFVNEVSGAVVGDLDQSIRRTSEQLDNYINRKATVKEITDSQAKKLKASKDADIQSLKQKAVKMRDDLNSSALKEKNQFLETRVPEVKEGLKKERIALSESYGKGLDDIFSKFDSPVPSDNTISALEGVFEKRGIMDASGFVEDRLASLSRGEKKAVDLYNKLIDSVEKPTIYGPTGAVVSGGEELVTNTFDPQDFAKAMTEFRAGSSGSFKAGRGATPDDVVIGEVIEAIGSSVEDFGGEELRALNSAYRKRVEPLKEGMRIFKPYKTVNVSDSGESLLKRMKNKGPNELKALRDVEKAAGVKFVDDSLNLTERAAQNQAALEALLAAEEKKIVDKSAAEFDKLKRRKSDIYDAIEGRIKGKEEKIRADKSQKGKLANSYLGRFGRHAEGSFEVLGKLARDPGNRLEKAGLNRNAPFATGAREVLQFLGLGER